MLLDKRNQKLIWYWSARLLRLSLTCQLRFLCVVCCEYFSFTRWKTPYTLNDWVLKNAVLQPLKKKSAHKQPNKHIHSHIMRARLYTHTRPSDSVMGPCVCVCVVWMPSNHATQEKRRSKYNNNKMRTILFHEIFFSSQHFSFTNFFDFLLHFFWSFTYSAQFNSKLFRSNTIWNNKISKWFMYRTI